MFPSNVIPTFSAILVIAGLLVPPATLWSQTSEGSPATQSSDQTSQTTDQTPSAANGAAPSAGQQPVPSLSSEFPPLSGLDEGTLEPNVAARSFLVFGAQAGESAVTNAGNNLNGGPNVTAVTHVLGDAALQRFWSRYETALSYVGGAAFYSGNRFINDTQVHTLAFDSRVVWRTGALTFRDRASYMPEGSFGGGFTGAGGIVSGLGGLGGLGAGVGAGLGAGGGQLGFFGQGFLAGFGTIPLFTNLATLDLQEALSPRSAFTLAGGFHFIHFIKATGGLLIDSQQTTAQAGYNYRLSRRSQIGAVYGYQHFHFPIPGAGGFQVHILNLLYGYQLSGRLHLTLGAGPQFTEFNSITLGHTTRLSAMGRAALDYKFPRTRVTLSYLHFDSAGSGLFAGARTDLAHLDVMRPLSRRWDFWGDVGYNHSVRLQAVNFGVPAGSFQSGYVGARLSRVFSRSLQGFVSYQYTTLAFDRSVCVNSASCGRVAQRHVATIGIAWRSRPYRLD
ncbi:MAG: hypothetical protein JO266_20485 [Acidobacteria bacterium]|nr:hypothetical protein [Acidobacteriota bacterium]MBV9483060.1 hypothetical protein [Acidobacteriota bacterium]